MSERFEFWETPKGKDTVLLAGWRHWVDGGAVSSGLPEYLIERMQARPIGRLAADDYYLFQLPGFQPFLRPIIQHEDGHPKALHLPRNEFHHAEVGGRSTVIFIGDEPHLNAERYVQDLLEAARTLEVKQVVMFGGIYAEVPYDRERLFTAIYSLPALRERAGSLAVDLSNYQGPSSISSYLCKRAGEQGLPLLGLYAFCPIYQFSDEETDLSETIHIENDHMAWLGAMRRVNHFLGAEFNLDDLEEKARQEVEAVKKRLDRLEHEHPELGVTEYMERLSSQFEERAFSPLEDVWEDELRRLSDKYFPPEE
ncbi:MAG: PAC2 family protein [Chloroflexi bacterium]|nr:PAC2 family protein [Chloroflexota bacterium]